MIRIDFDMPVLEALDIDTQKILRLTGNAVAKIVKKRYLAGRDAMNQPIKKADDLKGSGGVKMKTLRARKKTAKIGAGALRGKATAPGVRTGQLVDSIAARRVKKRDYYVKVSPTDKGAKKRARSQKAERFNYQIACFLKGQQDLSLWPGDKTIEREIVKIQRKLITKSLKRSPGGGFIWHPRRIKAPPPARSPRRRAA